MHLHHCSRAGRMLPGRPRLRARRAGGRQQRHGRHRRRSAGGRQGARVLAPLGQSRVGGPADHPTSSGATAGRPWCSPSTPRISPRGAPPRCRPSPTSTTPSSGPTSWSLGISADSLETHRRFAASLDLPFRLLSDPDSAGRPQVRQQAATTAAPPDGLRGGAGRPGQVPEPALQRARPQALHGARLRGPGGTRRLSRSASHSRRTAFPPLA